MVVWCVHVYVHTCVHASVCVCVHVLECVHVCMHVFGVFGVWCVSALCGVCLCSIV